jgi:hypothetical protein
VPAPAGDDGAAWTVEFAPHYRRWTLTEPGGAETALSQWQLPVLGTHAPGGAFDLVVHAARTRSTAEFADGREAALSAVTALDLKGFWTPGGRTLVTLGVGLPAGTTPLEQGAGLGAPAGTARATDAGRRLRPAHEGDPHDDSRDAEVAQLFWSPLLGFSEKRLGRGLVLEAGVARLFDIRGGGAASLGVSAVHRGEYELLETEDGIFDFDPGDELAATFGCDVDLPNDFFFGFDATGRLFTKDRDGAGDLFHRGPQIEGDLVVGRDAPGWSFALRARGVTREPNRLDGGVVTDDQGTEWFQGDATGVWASGQLFVHAGRRVALGAEADYGRFNAVPEVLSDGWTLGVGPSLRVAGVGRFEGRARVAFLSGQAADGAVDLGGVETMLAVGAWF